MELKEKKTRLFEMFNVSGTETFTDSIMRVIYSGDSSYYDKYVDLFPDLSKDELRSVWQFGILTAKKRNKIIQVIRLQNYVLN